MTRLPHPRLLPFATSFTEGKKVFRVLTFFMCRPRNTKLTTKTSKSPILESHLLRYSLPPWSPALARAIPVQRRLPNSVRPGCMGPHRRASPPRQLPPPSGRPATVDPPSMTGGDNNPQTLISPKCCRSSRRRWRWERRKIRVRRSSKSPQ
jgi:hypothetical protein